MPPSFHRRPISAIHLSMCSFCQPIAVFFFRERNNFQVTMTRNVKRAKIAWSHKFSLHETLVIETRYFASTWEEFWNEILSFWKILIECNGRRVANLLREGRIREGWSNRLPCWIVLLLAEGLLTVTSDSELRLTNSVYMKWLVCVLITIENSYRRFFDVGLLVK